MDIVLPLLVFSTLGGLIFAGLFRLIPADERRWLWIVIACAFVLRIGAATVFAIAPQFRLFHDDADGYEYLGLAIAADWSGEGPSIPSVPGQNIGYTYVAAGVYYLFGRFRVNLSYFSAVMGTTTVILVYMLARMLAHKVVARRAVLFTAFMPSMILWSSVALKDPLMSCLIVLSLLSCLHLKERMSIWSVLGVVLPLAAIQPIRFYIVYFVGFAVAASLLVDRSIRLMSGLSKPVVLLIFVLLLFPLIGLAKPAQDGADVLSFKRVSTYRSGMARTADSGFSSNVDVSTPGRALAFLPVGMSVLLLGPFPWQITSLRAAMAVPEAMVWWIMFPSMIRGVAFLIRRRFSRASPLIIFSVTLTCAYSLVHGNVGSAFRQRAQVFIFLFVFAALGWYQKRCRKLALDEHLLLTPASK